MKIRKSFVTNSSSSSFVCEIKMTPEEAEESLRQFFSNFNILMDTNYNYDECIGNVYIYQDDPKRSFYHVDTCWENKDNEGKLIITSDGDNSIPYEMHDLIESKYLATRYHGG